MAIGARTHIRETVSQRFGFSEYLLEQLAVHDRSLGEELTELAPRAGDWERRPAGSGFAGVGKNAKGRFAF